MLWSNGLWKEILRRNLIGNRAISVFNGQISFNFKYSTVHCAFSKSLRYKQLSGMEPKAFEVKRNCATQVTVRHQLLSLLSSAS